MKQFSTMKNENLDRLFTPTPKQWGLRGDPYLWNELEQVSKLLLLPQTVDDLEDLLLVLFKNLTGRNLEKGQDIFVKRFAAGGMSSGVVCSDFWLENGLPSLKKKVMQILIKKNLIEYDKNLMQKN